MDKMFKKTLTKVVEEFIEEERANYSHKFLTFDNYKEKIKRQIVNNFEEYLKSLKNGYEQIIETIDKKIPHSKVHDNYKIDFQHLYRLGEIGLITVASKPKGIQELLCLSDEALELYFQASSMLLKEKKFKEAADAFLTLCLINSLVSGYWVGLGIAKQSEAHYEEALECYAMAEILAPSDPVPPANAMQCYLALGQTQMAKENLEQALELCITTEHKELKRKLNSLKQELKI